VTTTSLLLDLLQHPIAAAKAAGATDVEIAHYARTLGMARFAGSTITTSGVVVERVTRVRAAVGAKVGAATTTAIDVDALAVAARQAVGAAEHSPDQPHFAGFATAGSGSTRQVADATAACGPGERAAVIERLFARAARDGLVCAGAFTTGPRVHAVATAGGVALEHESADAQLACIALDGDASGHAVWAGADLAALDPDALADEACAKAARARGAGDLEPGPQDVVLAPAAVAELLEWMAMASFSAKPFLDGMSLLSGRAGEALCDERITILDDPEGGGAAPFDAEGTPRQRVVFIDSGRAGRPISDRATAARLGAPSTGHAPPVSFGVDLYDGPAPANLVILPGADSVDDLIARVDNGLFVTRFHYVNGFLDTRRAVMTGMTRDGTFTIENGKLGRAVKNLRFTEGILGALGRVGGIGRTTQAIPSTWLGVGPLRVPALLLRGFHFTGKSR
jgi:predicted Zn-dependent protease